jgi:anti-anti-sigma factor
VGSADVVVGGAGRPLGEGIDAVPTDSRALMELRIGVACEDGVTIVSVAGELDVSNAARLVQKLNDVISIGVSQLILDIEQLSYMDSAGLSVLIGAHKQMELAGGSFRVMAPSHIVSRLFEVTGVESHLAIHRPATARHAA